MGTALFFAEQKDALSTIIKNDLSYISILIMSLYVCVSIYIGRLCYLSDRMTDKNKVKREKEKKHLENRMDLGWFSAEHFFSLGLLGTIIGLIFATSGSLDSSLPVGEIVSGLKEGLNTAFYTTVCGIIFSLPLQFQIMILKYKINGDK